jgi:hypothetical protein
MSVGYSDSYGKTLSQIRVVAKERFEVDGKAYVPPEEGLVLSASFWQRYGCYLGCGGCCRDFSLDYLPYEWALFCRDFPQYADRGRERSIEVNGRPKTLVTIANDESRTQEAGGALFCQFLNMDSGSCSVHAQNPYSCRVELIKLREIAGTGYILKGHFGRAWNMMKVDGERGDLLCDFSDFSEEQLLENDIPVLKQLMRWASYLGIHTYIPDILDTIDACLESRRLSRVVIVQEA